MQNRKWIAGVITVLALSQLMCSFSSPNPASQLTSVAEKVQKTADVIKKTAEAFQNDIPSLEDDLQQTVEALQTEVSDAGGLKLTMEAMKDQALTEVVPFQPADVENGVGFITGQLSYPSEFIPPLTIVAYQLDEKGSMNGDKFMVDTLENSAEYELDVPAGKYFVVAYLRKGTLKGIDGLAAGYTRFMLCGATAECTDHSLVVVEVKDGEITGGINPQDWAGPGNDFPPEP